MRQRRAAALAKLGAHVRSENIADLLCVYSRMLCQFDNFPCCSRLTILSSTHWRNLGAHVRLENIADLLCVYSSISLIVFWVAADCTVKYTVSLVGVLKLWTIIDEETKSHVTNCHNQFKFVMLLFCTVWFFRLITGGCVAVPVKYMDACVVRACV